MLGETDGDYSSSVSQDFVEPPFGMIALPPRPSFILDQTTNG